MSAQSFPGGYATRPEGPYYNVIADADTARETHIGRIRLRLDADRRRQIAEPDFMGKPLGAFASLEAAAMMVIAAYESLGGCHGLEREAEFDAPSPFGLQCAQVLSASALDAIAGHLESAVRHSGERLNEGERVVMSRTARGLRDMLRMARAEPSPKPHDAARADHDAAARWTAADEALYQALYG